MFNLFVVLIAAILGFILGVIERMLGIALDRESNMLAEIYALVMLIPLVSAGVRRMHDTDHRALWLLVPFVNLVLALKAGTPGDNRFGPDPKATVTRA